MALSLAELASVLDSLGLEISTRARSSLRFLWTRYQPAAAPGLSSSSALPSGDSLDLTSGSRSGASWNEPFPAKLSPELIRELCDNFERQYPGERR